MAKIEYVEKRNGVIVPFTPERITNAIYRTAVAVGGRDKKTAEKLSQQVVTILEQQTPLNHIPTIEEIQDVVEKVLIENGHAKVAKAYILYREERNRKRQERAKRAMWPSENIPWAKIWHVIDWAADNEINTIEKLNNRIKTGELNEIIRISEQAYHEDVENAVEMIAQQKDTLKLVIITGPSSSGKTTTTIKLGQGLQHLGLKLVTLNVDNYFFDLEIHPKDEFGDYDFETPQALDLELINDHLEKLIAGEEIYIPFYDFKTGKRFDNQTRMKINPNEIILIDSLHGLFPDMTASIPDEQKFKLYLEPLMQLKDSKGKYVRWTDIRLMRRMLRDSAYRAYDPRQTLLHWHYVRSSEMRNIIPYINSTDYVVNSAMPYELGIYKPKLIVQFQQWAQDYKDDPLREDAYLRAERVYALLQEIEPIDDEAIVPKDSVIREFIGGSIYNY